MDVGDSECGFMCARRGWGEVFVGVWEECGGESDRLNIFKF